MSAVLLQKKPKCFYCFSCGKRCQVCAHYNSSVLVSVASMSATALLTQNETMGLAVCIELQLADTLCAQCIGCAFDYTCNQKEKQKNLSKISLWGRILNSKI